MQYSAPPRARSSIPDADDARRAIELMGEILDAGLDYYDDYQWRARERLRSWPADERWLPGAMDVWEIVRHLPLDFGGADALEAMAREQLCGCRRREHLAAMQDTVDAIHRDRAAAAEREARMASADEPPALTDRERAIAAERRRRERRAS